LPEQPSSGSVTLTPWRALLVAALFGGLAGWLVVVTANAFDVLPPRIPWTAPIGIAVFAALVGALAWSTHQRLQVRRERMEPQRAVAFLALGKASALAGAAVAGGYLGFALMFLTRIDAATPRDRVIRAAVAVVAGVGLMIAGLRLERACKVPDDEDEDEPDYR
jgi:small-conductance mechanosensitive channel